jgi:hypothetical protein
LDHLACVQIHGDEAFVRLAGDEQSLSFDVHVPLSSVDKTRTKSVRQPYTPVFKFRVSLLD